MRTTGGDPHADVPVSLLTLGNRLGTGGQGDVFAVANRPGVVFKRYHGAPAHPATLSALVDFPGKLTLAEQEMLERQAAWPQARVVDNGKVVGFLMREIPGAFFGRTAGGRKGRELQYLLYERKPLWGDIVPLAGLDRIDVAQQCAALIGMFHRHGMVFGDISMRNLLWSPGPPSAIYLIDCDGPIPSGLPSVQPQADTPDWDDPRQPASGPDLDTDRYKLALVIGRVLAGQADARPGAPLAVLSDVPTRVARAVEERFAEAAGPHGTRPDAAQWLQALAGRGEIKLPPPPQLRAPGVALPAAPLVGDRGERTPIVLKPPAGSGSP